MPAVTQQIVTISGEVVAWRVLGSEGWGAGTLRVAAADPLDAMVPFTGKLVTARVGDTVELQGVWHEHPRFGRQLKARTCTVARPDSADGIVAWLSSTLPDVGEARARALVDRFGGELWSVIEHRPHELAAVSGITPKRTEAIVAAYHAHRADRDHMIQLRGWGLTDSQISRCIEVWGSVAVIVEHVRENPYQLCEHVYGFGFLRADKVATRAGVPHDSPARLNAGVEHVLEEAASAGHCYMSGAALQNMAAKLLGVDGVLVGRAIKAAIGGGRIARREGARYYPRRLDEAEQVVADRLLALIERGAANVNNVIDLQSRRKAQ